MSTASRPLRGEGSDPEPDSGLDLGQPRPIVGPMAPRHAEVEVVDPLDERPDLAVPHGDAVDGADRHDLPAAAAEERLVAEVELRAVDVALLDPKIQPPGGGARSGSRE